MCVSVRFSSSLVSGATPRTCKERRNIHIAHQPEIRHQDGKGSFRRYRPTLLRMICRFRGENLWHFYRFLRRRRRDNAFFHRIGCPCERSTEPTKRTPEEGGFFRLIRAVRLFVFIDFRIFNGMSSIQRYV